MEQDLALYDEDEYQSKAIATLCETLLSMGNVKYSLEELTGDLDQCHVRAYNFLRIALREFEKGTELPLTTINVEPPRGGIYQVITQKAAEHYQ